MSGSKYNWDAIAAIIAALIGLLAIFISAYTAWNVRQQTRAQVWPHLELVESDFLSTKMTEENGHGGRLLAINRGVGPAIVRSVEVLVDGKPQLNWTQVFKALGFHSSIAHQQSSLNHMVLSPGEQLAYLDIFGKKNWVRFKSRFFNKAVVRICYCSTLGECWSRTLGPRKSSDQGQSVNPCSGIPMADQFRG